ATRCTTCSTTAAGRERPRRSGRVFEARRRVGVGPRRLDPTYGRIAGRRFPGSLHVRRVMAATPAGDADEETGPRPRLHAVPDLRDPRPDHAAVPAVRLHR